MKKIEFNRGWSYKKQKEEVWQPVLLPHDAMIHEPREAKAPGGGAHGYFPGGSYEYKKTFFVPQDWEGDHILIAFEGVYRNCKVFLNGQEIGSHRYGYTPFTVQLESNICYGQDNEIRVFVDNSELPNSRWYTGSGIYRPVYLYHGGSTCIAYRGIKIETREISPVVIHASTEVIGEEREAARVLVEILDKRGVVKAKGEGLSVELEIPDAKLWSDETPNLYECRVTLMLQTDPVEMFSESFGIRQMEYSKKGFYVNGKEVLLKGGCIHHDQGILGASTWDKSEERRVRIMKENGFNAIRMSHNPASDALVRACDKFGMYLIDEAFDMWYVRKSKYDYGRDFHECWKSDVKAMVERDYNHPSVVMYSIGNEVSEPGKEAGLRVGKEMISFIKQLDSTRIVTGGMNLMIMGNYAKGRGHYDQVDQEKLEEEERADVKNASLAFNMMATFVGSGMNKAGNSKKVDQITTPILDALDIAGYNYGSGRYPLEAKVHPDRVIFGSETFPQDIYKNWEMVKTYPYLIGDFMWTAWDYLGEAGIGVWSYSGGKPFNRPYPCLLGGAGVIDILGNPDVSCRNAQIVWQQITHPVIGVRPVNHPGIRVSKSVWRGTNAIESWSWKDCIGNRAEVEVHTLEPVVELFLNDMSVGKKKTKSGVAYFKTRYQAGVIRTVTYDKSGQITGFHQLQSAEGKLHMELKPEEEKITAGNIGYVPLQICDDKGIVESNGDTKVHLSVEGGILLAFGSANPITSESYDQGVFTTYQGKAMAICYAENSGILRITAKSMEYGQITATIEVE